MSLAPVGAIKNNMDENQMQEVISEIVTTAIRNTEVHFNLSQYPTCPRLSRYVPPPTNRLPVHYDSMVSHFAFIINLIIRNLWIKCVVEW